MNFPIHNVINNDSDVEIAILDTGVDINHPVLKSSIEKGFDAFGYENINDENGHGTHIAGVIVRDTSQTKIIPIKVLDHNGKGDLFTILQGLQYAIDQKIEIINMSLGISKDIPLLKEKIDEAIDKGSIIISSSGNEGKSSLQYPANYPNVISVGAYDINEAIASFSQYGENLDFVAPGVDIWSTWNDGELKMHSGTSIAAAFVTKAVGLIKSSKPNIKNEDIVDVLINSAKPLAQETEKQKMGYGKIDVSKALDISSGEIKYFKSKHDVPTNKIWSVTMSGAIDAKLFNKQLIKVIDEQGKIMQIEPVIDKTNPSIIKIMPPITGYEIGQSYQLIIEKGIVSKDDKNLQKEVRMQFTIEE
nr:S8 family serine peptidase [Lysinibacillus endophyticus]